MSVANRCHRMLISEPDTQGALFKAENILRELVCDASDILSDHTPLQPAGEEDKTIYNKMAANYTKSAMRERPVIGRCDLSDVFISVRGVR